MMSVARGINTVSNLYMKPDVSGNLPGTNEGDLRISKECQAFSFD